MKQLMIFQKDACTLVEFEGKTTFLHLAIVEKKNGVQVGKQFIKDNQLVFISNNLFYCLSNKRTFSFYSLGNETMIGRDKSCEICIPDECISNFHMRIYRKENDFILEDLNSTNGTYCDLKRVHSMILSDGMHIHCVYVFMIYYDGFLLISYPLPSSSTPSFIELENPIDFINQKQPPNVFDPLIIELESYIMDQKVEKQNLFQSIGSSLLILLSSLLSCVIMYCLYPEQKTQLLSMVLMSGSMSIAFLIYGLYNRHANYQMNVKRLKENENLYYQYLDSLTVQIKEFQRKQKQICSTLKEEYLTFNVSTYEKLLLGFKNANGVEFKYRKYNYQQVNHAMVTYQQEWIKTHQIQIQQPVYLQNKEIIVPNDLDWVYGFMERALFSKVKPIVVWVGECFKDSYLLFHPSSIDHYQRLWIHDQQSCKRVLSCLNQEDVWFVVADEQFQLPENGYKLILSECEEKIDFLKYSPNRDAYRNHLLSLFEKSIISPYSWLQWQDKVNLKIIVGMDHNRPIYLQMEENQDGCHALVAGSTGSGKSEFLSALLLQLIVNNNPLYFQYILIDFKGGAFGSVFTGFPHFAGMITNLDEDGPRFMNYITNFVNQRQEMIKSFIEKNPAGIGHIDSYNQFHPNHPLSHLFIIVDEFAQLKSQSIQLYQYMKELARIGRSLGIHLILATQKPMGVVDDQIWANANVHICLRVANKQDSKEILHNDAAYFLQKAGQFILQTSSRQETGQSFYIHDTISSSRHSFGLSEKDEIMDPLDEKSILDFVYEQVQSFSYHQNLIIPASLKEYEFLHEFGVYEDVKRKKTCRYDVKYGQVCTILTTSIQKTVQAIVSVYNKRVYTINIFDMDLFVDECFFDESIIWQIKKIKDPITLIVSCDSIENLKVLFNQKNIRLFILVSQCTNAFAKQLEAFDKICMDSMNLDTIRMFFQDYQIKTKECLLKTNNHYYSFLLNSFEASFKEKKVHLETKESGCVLGKNERGQNVIWNQKEPLVICFVQKSMKNRIDQMIKRWNVKLKVSESLEEEFDVCICDVLKNQAVFQSQRYLENMYDWSILWVGKGVSDYAYQLHKKMPVQPTNMTYWHEDIQESLLWKEY